MRMFGWLATLVLAGCSGDTVTATATRAVEDVATETAVAETAVAETAVLDTAVLDTAVLDTAVLDTAVLDTAVADTAVADTVEVDIEASVEAVGDTAADDGESDLRDAAEGGDSGAPAACGPPSLRASSSRASRSNAHPVFTHDVTEVAKLALIHPLGAAWGGEIRGHTYLQIDQASGVQSVDVYAPVDAVLEAVILYAYHDDPARGDWGLRFRTSCEVAFRLGHLTDPVATIRELWTGPPATDSRLWVELAAPIPFAAGDLIAKTSGTREAHNFDFGVYNTTVVHQFANQARYLPPEPRPWDINYMVNSDCPYDYFAEALRTAYMARLGGILAGGPVVGATCRSAMRDVVGTAAGAWWSDAPVTAPYRERIGIVSEYTGFVVIGGLGPTGTLVFADAAPPESVTSTHCYANDHEHVELSLVAADTLFIAYGAGACPGTPLSTPGGQTYVR